MLVKSYCMTSMCLIVLFSVTWQEIMLPPVGLSFLLDSHWQVHGVCLLLSCNVETLMPLEFIHCHLYPEVMDKICKSLCRKGSPNHKIQCFSIKSSRICEPKPGALTAGLINFLSSGKSLRMLSLNDTKMPPTFSKMIFHTLMESSHSLQTLEISEHNISG